MPSWHAGTTGAVEDLFIPAKTYEGSRPGYVFSTRDGRTGYYSDARAAKRPRDDGAESAAAKRARPDDDGGVEAILAKADEAEITELDAASLKRLLLSLEKKITRNQQLRVKYGDDPSRFAESEVDLDDALQQMGLCAAAPELYGSLCDLGGVASIVGLLSHENADISASACSLLYDLTDADVVDSSEAGAAGAATLAAAIEAAQGLGVLASNVARFDEAVTEEAEAVHNTLGVFENVLDVGGPGAAEAVAAKTCLGPWLLARAGVKGFGPIKLYASEILSILAGASEAAAGALAEAEVGGADGVDALLTACAYYRKRAPAVGDEEECVENLFQALGSLVSSAPATTLPRLVRSEGVELLVKCAKEGKHAAACALRVLAGALEWGNLGDDGDANPLPPFFACGGLKVLFPALRGRGAARGAIVAGDKRSRQRGGKIKRRRRLVDDQRDLDEHVVSVAASICLYAGPEAPDLAMKRLLAKFAEDDCRAVKALADRYAAYARDVRAAAEDPVAAADGPDARLARALRAGLHALRLTATALAFAAVYSPRARAALLAKLAEAATSPNELANALADYARDVGDGADAATGDAELDAAAAPGPGLAATLRAWAAALSALAQPS